MTRTLAWKIIGCLVALLSALAGIASAQNTDLTVDVLINSTNTTGYNTDPASPGEYQRYPERYLENFQIPYRVIDVSSTPPPAGLNNVPLIIAAHRGLNLSSAWQQAILAAVGSGVGFVNLDWDTAIGTNAHMQAIFGCASSAAGTAGTTITIPATYLPDGATPHYITQLQLRWPIGNPTSATGDMTYFFHQDDNGNQGTAASTVLLDQNGNPDPGGTVLATIGSDAFWTVTTFGAGHAVNIGTYDYLRADRFGFLMGIDDLFWRSLVWAARKPFAFRGYPRFFGDQQDDPVDGYSTRVGDEFNPAFTGTGTTQTLITGTPLTIGGPWRVTANVQTDDSDFNNGTQQRQSMINYVAGGYLVLTPHTVTGGEDGDLFWSGAGDSIPLTDAQWLANYNAMLTFQQGAGSTGSFNGGSDFLAFGTYIIPHFWDFSNNIGYDMWQLGIRYVTELQQPNVFYDGGCKTPAQRMPGLHPYRVYEQPPANCNPNEIYSFFWADNYTLGSRAGFPSETFFGFATELQGMDYPSFDAKWPQAANGISAPTALENWEAYLWRFWSSMDPVQIYNHDGGSMANSTDQERQQHITNVSSFVSASGGIPIAMQDLGAYLHARVNSDITGGSVTPNTITLDLSGSATDMNGAPVTTESFVFFQNDGGTMVDVPGFTSGTTISIPNVTPPTLAVNVGALSFQAVRGDGNPPSQNISVSNSGTGTLNWSATSSASWLTLAPPASGTNSGEISASVAASSLSPGTYAATVTVSAPGAQNSSLNILVTLVIQRAPQTISFPVLPNPVTFGVSPITLNATASSGLPVSYTVSGPASLSGSILTILGVGSVTVTASQSGNTDFNSAASVPQTITVNPEGQSITFPVLPVSVTFGVSPITLNATASSGLPVSYTVSGPASVSGSTLTILGGGSVTVTANQSGNTDFSAATPVSQTITVNPEGQSINFPALPTVVTFGVSPIALQAKASSGLAVSYAVSGPASLSGSTLTILGVGSVTVTANQSGNANFAAATPVSQTITVNAAATPAFSITGSTQSLTLQPGQSGTVTITVTPSGGFDGQVSFSCGQQTLVTCSFNPPSLTPEGSPVTTTLTVTASSNIAGLSVPVGHGPASLTLGFGVLFGGVIGAVLLNRPRRYRDQKRLLGVGVLMALFVGLLIVSIAACGGGGGMSSSGGGTQNQPQTGTVTVSASAAGGSSQTLSLTITVNP